MESTDMESTDMESTDMESTDMESTDMDPQSTTPEPVTSEELVEVIAELERYRERLVDETMTTMQRAKLPKSAATAQLEPELAKIDAMLQNLREQQAALGA